MQVYENEKANIRQYTQQIEEMLDRSEPSFVQKIYAIVLTYDRKRGKK